MSKLIRLSGKHAVGPHRHAIVDDDMFEHLNQWKWKAKPNGNGTHIYAVRDVYVQGGSTTTVRMHRYVIGYAGPLDVDHRNRITLDNRKDNLRVTTRSINIKNTFTKWATLACKHCLNIFVASQRGGAPFPGYCSDDCLSLSRNIRDAAKRKELSSFKAGSAVPCEQCGSPFYYKARQRYCSQSCKSKAKWQKWKAYDSFPPSVLRRTGHPCPQRIADRLTD